MEPLSYERSTLTVVESMFFSSLSLHNSYCRDWTVVFRYPTENLRRKKPFNYVLLYLKVKPYKNDIVEIDIEMVTFSINVSFDGEPFVSYSLYFSVV